MGESEDPITSLFDAENRLLNPQTDAEIAAAEEKYKISPQLNRHLKAAETVHLQTEPEDIDFLHSCFCQIAIPRSKQQERVFYQKVGGYSLRLEAGSLYNEPKDLWVEQPLPYGVIPRLILIYATTQAKKTKSRTIHVGRSMSDFLNTIGVNRSGGKRGGITNFKKQALAFSACRMQMGFLGHNNRSTTESANIIKSAAWSNFDVWTNGDERQLNLWENEIVLSEDFYQSIQEHSVPLDRNAIAGLHDNALALDIYAWMAHRLYRLKKPLWLPWELLRQQFYSNYGKVDGRLKSRLRTGVLKALNVYPGASVEEKPGGYEFRPSLPPVKNTKIFLSGQKT